jgi:uncharacterized protein
MPMPIQILRGARALALAAALAAVPASCRDQAPATPAAAPVPKSVADYFTVSLGGHPVRLQLAVLEPEMRRGLMDRRDLGRDDGMVFVYAAPLQMHFWMRDTPTALDIGFFTPSGILAETYPMYPFDEKVINSIGSDLQFAVEMNQGWYAANGVGPGARLDLVALAAALCARGFDPARFGLAATP